MITWENYEEYMMMHADSELKPAEDQELMTFLDAHPELKKEMALYERVKLVPDDKVVFENKKSLLRSEAGKRVIAFPMWQRYGIAAGIAAIVFISLFKWGTSNNNNNIAVTKVDTIKRAITIPQNNTVAQSQNTGQQQTNTVATNDTIVKVPVTTRNVAVAVSPVKHIKVTPETIKQPASQQHHETIQQAPVAIVNNPIDRMSPAAIKELPSHRIAAAMSAMTDIPSISIAPNNDEKNTPSPEKLSIDDLKEQGMESVATALANGLEKIKTIKQEIGDTRISVRIEKRKFILSF